ncbi:MAG: BatD family protein [Phenylobacterium sp.]|uniref:BatD family protein n=1 Tax=Phenylobacterium sp. TaxID=1871053 RepID=UPI00272842B0|nr:BatD family protein [Phenylobacterium sp.]MDO8411517.1 BatD family protein [Phenylobacterium sp.]
MVNLRRTATAFAAVVALWGAPAMGQSVTGAFEAPDKPLWAGEVFDLTLAWTVDWATFGNLEGELEWASEPLVAEPWGEPALRNPPAPGAARAVIEFKTRAMALQPGLTPLSPASQVMRLQTGVVDMEEYQRAITETRTIESDTGLFNIRPLPPAPEGFTGAVGQFTVTSEVEAEEIRVGESLTWRVTLSGTGNWPAIRGLPPRQVSRDFEVVGAPELDEAEGSGLFERTLSETVVLVPQRAGRYVLSDFEMVVFNPQAGRFERVRADAITLDVLPGPNGDLVPPDAASPDAAEDEARLPPMLKGQGSAVGPPAGRLWFAALLALPLMLAALWGLLALWRAHQTDPDRIPRAAHRRLAATLARLARSAETAERRRLVRAWQADAALRWRLGLAAPAPDAFPDPEWRALWAQADQFLYARAGVLADDWTPRAQAALADLGPPPPFKPATALRRGNLLPAAAMAGLALMVMSGQALAQDMTAQALRQSVAEAPLDWRARHNLAIALAAQDQWEEAAGHAAIAWLHNPADPQTRQLWMTTSAKAGYSLEPRASVPRPRDWRGRAIAIASPAAWRWLLIGFAWVAAAGLGAALYARYRPRRHLAQAGLALAGLALVGVVICATALSGYGVLASDRAVLVWGAGPLRPLPVDTPAEEAEIQLAGGAVGRVDKAYLGWRRVRLADGRSGWTRAERLLPVWDSPN